MNISGTSYADTQPNTLNQPVFQIGDLKMELNTFAFEYTHTSEVLGKSTRFKLGQGCQYGTWDEFSPIQALPHGQRL